jgi:dynein heavy chain
MKKKGSSSRTAPRDSISLENRIVITNRFIRNLEKDRQMDIVKLTDENLVRTLENAIRSSSRTSPILDCALQKQIYKQSSTDIPYHWDFRLDITTQLPSPHCLPELCAKVALLDFTCTPAGLEEQLLALVVAKERPQLEEMKSKLVVHYSKNKRKLHEIHAKMLGLLENTDPNRLLETLTDSNQTSQSTRQQQVRESDATEVEIDRLRQTNAGRSSSSVYRPLASYISFFGLCIDDTPPSEVRLTALIDAVLQQHLPVAFRTPQAHASLPALLPHNAEPRPDVGHPEGLARGQVARPLPAFDCFLASFESELPKWRELFDCADASQSRFPGGWQAKFTLFQCPLLLCAIPNAVRALILHKLGQTFIESPQFCRSGRSLSGSR